MTNSVAIVSDTTACIPQEKAREYGIELMPVVLIFSDRVYRDGIDITPSQFYTMLRQAELLRGQIASRFNYAELSITEFTPVMGVHTGPGVVGVAFYGEDLVSSQ